MTAEAVKNKWSHKDNLAVYEEVSLSFFDEFAKEAGLDGHCDLKQIDSYIRNADSILEVGGGSGRVLDYFKKINFSGKVTTVEWSKPLYEHLKRNYGDSVEVIYTDIMDYQPKKKFDLIVWMWGSLSDFSSYEHKTILTHLCSILSDGGVIAFDTVDSRKSLPKSTRVAGNNYELTCRKNHEKTSSNLNFYFISQKKIISYVQSLGMRYSPTNFSTNTGVGRVMHLVFK